MLDYDQAQDPSRFIRREERDSASVGWTSSPMGGCTGSVGAPFVRIASGRLMRNSDECRIVNFD